MKQTHDELQRCRDQLKLIRAEKINLELEMMSIRPMSDGGVFTDEDLLDSSHSEPVTRRSSPMIESGQKRASTHAVDGREGNSYALLRTMHEHMEEKQKEIDDLKKTIQVKTGFYGSI